MAAPARQQASASSINAVGVQGWYGDLLRAGAPPVIAAHTMTGSRVARVFVAFGTDPEGNFVMRTDLQSLCHLDGASGQIEP